MRSRILVGDFGVGFEDGDQGPISIKPDDFENHPICVWGSVGNRYFLPSFFYSILDIDTQKLSCFEYIELFFCQKTFLFDIDTVSRRNSIHTFSIEYRIQAYILAFIENNQHIVGIVLFTLTLRTFTNPSTELTRLYDNIGLH